jgi:glycosyltransferase involved in cell wall biosynthesis
MNSLVSVLIPCFNSKRWLGHCLRSILDQTWTNTEVIIVDDGSTDDSLNFARSFESKRIKVITQENQGATAARNRAYAEAQGEFIQFMDADDLLSPDKIEAQMELLQASPSDFISVSATMYFLDGSEPEQGILHGDWPMIDSDHPREWLIDMYGPERGSMVQPGAWLTPRTITDDIGPWNELLNRSPNDDGEYFARVVLRSKGIRRSRRGFNYYRKFIHGGSLSAQKSKEHLWGALKAQDLMRQALLAGGQEERARKALSRQYKELAFTAYPFAPEVTNAALQNAADLGFGDFQPTFPTTKGRLAAKMIGWRLARRINVYWHRLSASFKRLKN